MICRLVLTQVNAHFAWMVFGLMMLCPSSLRGEIIVTVEDGQIVSGNIARINVFIESDGPFGDNFAVANFEFNLETILSAGRVEFSTVQPRDYLTDVEYIFQGNSAAIANSLDVGVVGGVPPGTHFFGGDSTASFANLAQPLTSQKLLVSLEITSLSALPPNIGDQFQVVFDPSVSFFLDGNLTDVVPINVGASKFSGTITVVPEPMSFGVFAIASLGFILYRRSRPTSI